MHPRDGAKRERSQKRVLHEAQETRCATKCDLLQETPTDSRSPCATENRETDAVSRECWQKHTPLQFAKHGRQWPADEAPSDTPVVAPGESLCDDLPRYAYEELLGMADEDALLDFLGPGDEPTT